MSEIDKQSDDGLSREVWFFTESTGEMRLTYYAQQTRATKRHKWAGPKWDYADERHCHSKLKRPTEIPEWVIRDAVGRMKLAVHIGWTNAESKVAEVSIEAAAISAKGIGE